VYGLVETLDGGIFSLILHILYIYLVTCALVILDERMKNRILFRTILLVFLFFFLGWDEPFINKTVNKTDFSCRTDSDCAARVTSHSFCQAIKCTNKDWRLYKSLANRVVEKVGATSCLAGMKYECYCSAQNTCVTEEIYPDPHEF